MERLASEDLLQLSWAMGSLRKPRCRNQVRREAHLDGTKLGALHPKGRTGTFKAEFIRGCAWCARHLTQCGPNVGPMFSPGPGHAKATAHDKGQRGIPIACKVQEVQHLPRRQRKRERERERESEREREREQQTRNSEEKRQRERQREGATNKK